MQWLTSLFGAAWDALGQQHEHSLAIGACCPDAPAFRPSMRTHSGLFSLWTFDAGCGRWLRSGLAFHAQRADVNDVY